MAEPETWLTPAQVRQRLQISAETCYGLIAGGELRSARIGQRCIRISETSLCEFMRAAEGRRASS